MFITLASLWQSSYLVVHEELFHILLYDFLLKKVFMLLCHVINCYYLSFYKFTVNRLFTYYLTCN